MQFKRFITSADVKNTYQYIDSQKTYEIIRTLIYFGISFSLFAAGYIATKSKMNLLTVVAVLGCLPASKSLVSMIMFLRQKSCSEAVKNVVEPVSKGLECLYDLVFTTEKVTYRISHAAYKAKCLVLFSEKALDEAGLEAHIHEYMNRAGIPGVTVKVYTDLNKYSTRLSGMSALEGEPGKLSQEVINLLKEITL